MRKIIYNVHKQNKLARNNEVNNTYNQPFKLKKTHEVMFCGLFVLLAMAALKNEMIFL